MGLWEPPSPGALSRAMLGWAEHSMREDASFSDVVYDDRSRAVYFAVGSGVELRRYRLTVPQGMPHVEPVGGPPENIQ